MSNDEFDSRIANGVQFAEACESAGLSREELLSLLHSDRDQSVILDGELVDHLSDHDARTFLRMTYGALAQGARFIFTIMNRTESEVRALCDQAQISEQNVKITHEGRGYRVALQKLQ